MNFYKSNLEYLLKNIQSQKELLTFQEKYLKLLENKMENADDKAKAVATALAPANSQGGVYQVLENWLEKGE